MSVVTSDAPIEIERHAAHLGSLDDEDPPYTISGIAIGEGDVTVGQSGTKKKWTREALESAADTLEDRPLVVDHENSAYGVVGEVLQSKYQPDTGVLYEAELDDQDLAEKVANGRLEVSIRGFHEDVEEMQEDAETGAKLVTKLRFDNLSIVPTGAAPSNTVDMGELDADEVEAGEYQPPTVEAGPSMDLSPAECAEMLTVEADDGEDTEEAAKRPEGAEEHGNPNKFAEQPERYPAGEESPDKLEAEEENASDRTEDAEDETISPHDDADASTDEAAQSRGAGTGGSPDSTPSDITFISPTMTEEDTEDKLAEYDDPTVIEGDELSDLREKADEVDELAEKVEELEQDDTSEAEEASEAADAEAVEELKAQFEDDLAELKDRTAVLDEVDREDVDELAETDDPVILAESEYDELSGTVDEVETIYAEALSEHVALDAETVKGKFSLSEMKSELEDRLDDDESVEEELSPAPKGDDPEEEDLEEAAEEAHEEDELSEDDESVEEVQADLRKRVLGLDD